MCFFILPFISVLLVSYATEVNSGNMNDYEGAQVWRTILSKPNDTQIFRRLSDSKAISLWSLTPYHADYLIKAESKVEVNHILKDQNLGHAVMILNLKKRMDTQKIQPVFWDDNTLRVGHRLNLDQYPTLEIIDEYFDYLLENFPSICKVNTIGRTDGNRTIKVVRISNGNPRNKVIMITAGMHAREWIAITSALYLLDGLVTKYDQLPQYIRDQDWYDFWLLYTDGTSSKAAERRPLQCRRAPRRRVVVGFDNVPFALKVIVPLVNPDGFHYTQTRDRLWRKNRRKSNECVGVDINRNFGADWEVGNLRVSDECHDAYSGPEPFSEAESKALRNLIMRLDKKPHGLIDLHSYGKLILYPWGAKTELINDNNLHKETAMKMKEAIFNATGQRYNSGPSNTAVYPNTGAGVDWAYQAGVNLTFAIEAGGDKFGGFLFPPSSIKSIGKEVLAAVKVLAKTIAPQVSHRTWANGLWF